MIVATAGHIDHGKTALVRALTGVDTDRLPEEKRRGISIDLGFAYWPLADGRLIGFVDVPGHERFVRNMLAGVCGIDFVLLAVAADDGVMPQTVEHFEILRLLALARGIAVLTKADCVPPERIAAVAAEVRGLLAGSPLAAIPILPVSALTGTGMPALRQALQSAAAEHTARSGEGRHFRFAIDRAFSVAGMGTVVTGTVFDGSVGVGDRLLLSPRGIEVRVRGIQIHGRTAERAGAGARCAINLAGVERAAVARGDWLLEPRIHAPTQRIDVEITLLPTPDQPLPHRTPVHLHLGTADLPARIATRRGVPLAPGATSVAQLVLDRPAVALHGDRFILRDQAAQRTLGGGRVLDPFAPPGRIASPARLATVAAMAEAEAPAALAALLQIADRGIELDAFERAFNLRDAAASALYRAAGAEILGRERRVAILADRVAQLEQSVLDRLAQFHRAEPQASGIGVGALHDELAASLPPDAFLDLLHRLATARKLGIASSTVHLAGHDAGFGPADVVLWQRCLPLLLEGATLPPSPEQLAADLRVSPHVLLDLLHRKRKSGEVFQAADGRFYPRATLACLAASAAVLAASLPDGQFTAAQYRDAIGTGRMLAIRLLEVCDKIGVTERSGDVRRMRAGFAAFVGTAEPLVAAPRTPTAAGTTTDAQRTAAGPGHPGTRSHASRLR